MEFGSECYSCCTHKKSALQSSDNWPNVTPERRHLLRKASPAFCELQLHRGTSTFWLSPRSQAACEGSSLPPGLPWSKPHHSSLPGSCCHRSVMVPSVTSQQRTALDVKSPAFCRNQYLLSLLLCIRFEEPLLLSQASSSPLRISCTWVLALRSTGRSVASWWGAARLLRFPFCTARAGKCRHWHWVGVDHGEAEADAQPGRSLHLVILVPVEFGLLHHGDSRTLPSTSSGTFLSDTDLLPTGQQLGSWFGAS